MKRIMAVLILLLINPACTPITKNNSVVEQAATTTVVSTVTPRPTRETIAFPFPQHVEYAQHSILPSHRTQSQLDDDARTFYEYWKSNYVIADEIGPHGIQMYRIAFGKSEDAQRTTVSEGQGYGMMILPIMAGYDADAQIIFDGLWEFVKAHPSELDARLMDWNIPDEEGNASAFDGDADIAFGLLLADAQWGSDGRINYKAEAATMISGILGSTIGKESHLPVLGDWVAVGEPQYNQFTPRSSDFMLVNFRAFANASNDPVWNDVILQSQNVMIDIQTHYSPETGLLPDFIVNSGPAPAYFLENETDGLYYYNAGRVPWRVGLDALIYAEPASLAIIQKISHWIEFSAGGDPNNIRAGYKLDGHPLEGSDYFTTFFVAPFGVAAMNDSAQQEWLNAIYDSVYNTREDYYEDSINLSCLLVMSGNFWPP